MSSLFVNIAYTTTSLLQRGRSPSVSVRLTVNYNHDRCVTSIMATVAGWRSANSSERRKQRYRSTGISFILSVKKRKKNHFECLKSIPNFLIPFSYLIVDRDILFLISIFFFSPIIFLSFLLSSQLSFKITSSAQYPEIIGKYLGLTILFERVLLLELYIRVHTSDHCGSAYPLWRALEKE